MRSQLHPTSSRLQQLALLLVAMLTWVGCATKAPTIGGNKVVESRLDRAFQEWKGTPYRLGGATKSGIDCSAFVQIVYQQQFSISIPRTTQEQMKFGKTISPRQANTGDLVFFKTGSNTYHVGILYKPGYFMHASTSQGVTVTEIKNPYWNKRIIGVKRMVK